jgi:transposase
MDDWLPEHHLARFIAVVVSMLDLEPIRVAYAGRGSEAYDPSVLLSLLFYGYATRTFSSRRIEAATYDSVAFRYIAAGSHPDHDTIASFRKRFLGEIDAFFVQILQITHQMGFRQFLFRGFRAVKGEWSLVSSAFNLKQIYRLYVPA